MASSSSSFSLFPSVSVRKESSKTKRSLPSLRIPTKEPNFEMVGIYIEDKQRPLTTQGCMALGTHSTTKAMPRAHVTKPPNLYIPRLPSRLSTPPETHDDRQQFHAPSPELCLPPSPPRTRPGTPAASSEVFDPDATNPARRGSIRSTATATHSPVMRSMFPRYDPNVALSRQQYFPPVGRTQSVEPVSGRNSTTPYPPPVASHRRLYQSRPLTGQGASPLNLAKSHSGDIPLSSPEELLDVWSISNGQNQEADVTISLRLSW